MPSDWGQGSVLCVLMYMCIYARCIWVYNANYVSVYLCVLYMYMSGTNLQKYQINYCMWGYCVHRSRPCTSTDTIPGSACSHVIQGIIFSPCFYLNPDLVQHWETALAILLTAVNQSKKRAFGKHQHIEGYTIPQTFIFLVSFLSDGG